MKTDWNDECLHTSKCIFLQKKYHKIIIVNLFLKYLRFKYDFFGARKRILQPIISSLIKHTSSTFYYSYKTHFELCMVHINVLQVWIQFYCNWFESCDLLPTEHFVTILAMKNIGINNGSRKHHREFQKVLSQPKKKFHFSILVTIYRRAIKILQPYCSRKNKKIDLYTKKKKEAHILASQINSTHVWKKWKGSHEKQRIKILINMNFQEW